MPDSILPRLSRRGFLAASTAASLKATTGGASAPILRTAIFGCGDGGTRAVQALLNHPDLFRVTALSDVQPDRMHALAAPCGAPAEPDWRMAITREDVDAVIIATPDHLHTEMAWAALDAGKHVYLLPPVAPSATEARALHAQAANCDRLLYVGMEAAPAALWTAAAEQLHQRKGAPRWIQASCPPVAPDSRPDWSRDPACSQGSTACRVFSMLYPLQFHLGLGAPNRLTALGGTFDGKPGETIDALTCSVRYDGGTSVVLTCAPGQAHQQPAILRGPWPHAELTWTTGAFDVPRFDLYEFGRAITRGYPMANARLHAACSVQAALSEALENGIPNRFGPENPVVA